MEPVTLEITNELSAIPVLRAAAGAYAEAAGCDSGLTRQMELVVEGIVTNIIQYEYAPGQRERIELTLAASGGNLELIIRFKGIPFDIDYLRQCERISLEEMVASGGLGFGLRLIKQFSDEVQYRNLGREGQEIRILRALPSSEAASPRPVLVPQVEEQAGKPLSIQIRRMRPAEAAAVSRLAYFAYGYSYLHEHIYDPERVRQLNEENRIESYVAVNGDTGEIVGHCALIPDNLSDMLEMAIFFVDPAHRRSGCQNAMGTYMVDEVRKRKREGFFGMIVTSHPYSQKACVLHGMGEAALFLSREQPLVMRGIKETATARESSLYMVNLFDRAARGPYHFPPHHREMLDKICRNLDVPALFAADPGEIPLPEHGRLDQEADPYQCGHIFVRGYGLDSVGQVRRTLRSWCLDRLETIYLYLPLLQPPTAGLCARFEDMGFFFGGLRHGRAGEDWLMLQYLNNQRCDYGQLKAATPFGQELIDYVRSRDPVTP
jgi:serine/threonine-protein kinase RsbW